MRGTTSFTEIMKSQGKEPSSQVISYRKTIPSLQEVDKLGIDKTETIIRMERVRYADGIPVVYEVASIPEKFIKNFNREEVTSHFFQTLERHGYKIESRIRPSMRDWPRIRLRSTYRFQKGRLF